MAADPTASASFSKTNYADGELMVLTINHADVDRETLTVSGSVTDSSGNTATWSDVAVIDAGVVTWTETAGRVWTLLSATLNQSVFTATA